MDSGQNGLMPFGAEITQAGVRFRIFAPAAEQMRLQIEGIAKPFPLNACGDGWHELVTKAASAGSRYRYLLPDGTDVPDPASRFQPEDIAGPCEVIDPAFAWTDEGWRGRKWSEAVLYELHVGTFTAEGTFRAASTKLNHLQQLGITAIELMTVTEFPGNRNWGYDGVLPYAPDSAYGRPEDLKTFIDAAHARGMAVVMDVVYNHFGPEGNYIPQYFPKICSTRHDTSWGKGMNFDEEGSREVREYFLENVLFWLREYHADGLRLDASHMMKDNSPKHILDEMAERVRAAFPDREIYLILEDAHNVSERMTRAADGSAPMFTAQWNHDMTHLISAAFGNECPDRDPNAEETGRMVAAIAEGYILPPNAGEHPEESKCKAPPNAYICYTQTHDLIGNRVDAKRLHALVDAAALRASAALFVLMPQIPMLFMGQEWNASTGWAFFSDYHDNLGDEIIKGRCEFLKSLGNLDDEDISKTPDPQAESTFRESQLRWDDLQKPEHADALAFHRELIRVRRERIVPLLPEMNERCGDAEVLGPARFIVRWKLPDDGTLQLAANLCGAEGDGFPEPEGAVFWLEGSSPSPDRLGPWSVRWSLS